MSKAFAFVRKSSFGTYVDCGTMLPERRINKGSTFIGDTKVKP